MSRKARTEFEDVLMATRVAGFTGWDPPEDPEDTTPTELWDELVSLFPHGLQRQLNDPERDEDSRFGETIVTLTGEVPLSRDSGISLTVSRTISVDADEDGAYQHKSDKIDYALWVDVKDWTGDSVSKLRAQLHQFEVFLRGHDPAGHDKFLGK